MKNIMNVKDITCLYYPDENVFKTTDGQRILNIYPLVSPNMVFLFKHHKKSMTFTNYKYLVNIHLLYPLDTVKMRNGSVFVK